MRRWALFFVALVLGTALDLGTKAWAFEALARERTRPFNDWFAFTLATNKGAAFGMFWDRFEFFMAVTVVALVGLPYFVHTAPRRALALPTVLGLILSGVVGNFWDRVIHGHVRDFLDVHTPPAGALHDLAVRLTGRTVWPTFNVADIFITGGALILVVALGRDAPAAPSPPASAGAGAGPEGPQAGGAGAAGGGAVQPGAAPPVSA